MLQRSFVFFATLTAKVTGECCNAAFFSLQRTPPKCLANIATPFFDLILVTLRLAERLLMTTLVQAFVRMSDNS
ncbi:uncharacterized protein BYT42DRAFT_350054 [Radiomyces spectabilis]|uniref:uncharacterized protein n=1 Tax=Radiomyces spectabilis TaxID=64574 RepID=UPI0022204E24|nr:uncharacterized protein BYT42DRAFT_350054 [Radiomyces spectabilis]KAI8377600.1 hypothetical protein BYT42DRAFT_350054 [Radiomyces spectabilis]